MLPTLCHMDASNSRSQTVRESLISSLRGRTIIIPDLKPIFHDWTGIKLHHTSPLLEPLREKVRDRLETLNFDVAKHKRLQDADFALFTALWWPDSPSMGHLETLAYLVIWLFTWDDEIDEPTGRYTDDAESAQKYRHDTLHFVGACLGLSGFDTQFEPQSRIVKSFDVIGSSFMATYNTRQRQRFFDEIARFMAASETEQACRLQGRVFTLEEYWPVRMGTSAVYIGTAAGEFSTGSKLPIPPEIMQCGAMQALWNETNIIISITNDLLSLRKEMRLGCVDSVVPLTCTSKTDVQMATDQAVVALRASKHRFDAAARMLSQDLSFSEADLVMKDQLKRFVQVQRSNCVGNLVWSLETRRYNETDILLEDGSQTFVL